MGDCADDEEFMQEVVATTKGKGMDGESDFAVGSGPAPVIVVNGD